MQRFIAAQALWSRKTNMPGTSIESLGDDDYEFSLVGKLLGFSHVDSLPATAGAFHSICNKSIDFVRYAIVFDWVSQNIAKIRYARGCPYRTSEIVAVVVARTHLLVPCDG
jgi:hypothetical protein